MIDMIKLAWALQCRFLIWSDWLVPFNIDSFLWLEITILAIALKCENFNTDYSIFSIPR